ncbi:hypothetical protein DOY81_002069 [Sarcophaga bullata]|nr:hypothetical protein DOY81_002069 [Sarcophaga bullata]
MHSCCLNNDSSPLKNSFNHKTQLFYVEKQQQSLYKTNSM